MPVIITPAATLSGGSQGGSSSDSHSNIATLNRLSTDSRGNLCFNGKIVGEFSVETTCSFILTISQVQQKFIALPDDCDTSRAITLSLNGVAFPQGDSWEVRENVNSSDTDLIAWQGLGLEHFIQAGDSIFITYYKKI